VNHNNDGKEKVGPTNWALCDAEEDTALMRHNWFDNGRTHIVANLATWSPELMASQLNDVNLKQWMSGPGNFEANADEAMQALWQSVSPFVDPECDSPIWWNDTQEYIDSIHDKGKCNEKWYTPLNRLVDRLGISYPFSVVDESYGVVY
jgi:hypothetical protein